LPRSDPAIQKWVSTTEAILDAAFGKPDGRSHQMTIRFTHAGSFPIQRAGFSGRGGTPEPVLQRGVKFRRKPKLTPQQIDHARQLLAKEKEPAEPRGDCRPFQGQPQQRLPGLGIRNTE
jgi:hypothetical protein